MRIILLITTLAIVAPAIASRHTVKENAQTKWYSKTETPNVEQLRGSDTRPAENVSRLASSLNTEGFDNRTESFQYQGSARTTIRYLDAFGNVLGQQTYQDKVKVGVGPPQRSGSRVENNPIHLYFAPISNRNAPGQIEIHSAHPFTDSAGASFLLRYWSLSLNGSSIFGTLTNTHAEEATVINFLNAAKEIVPGRPNLGTIIWPYPMSKNSKLEGTFDRNQIKLHIQGNVDVGGRPFVSDIVASR
jgi:hypothetical protein